MPYVVKFPDGKTVDILHVELPTVDNRKEFNFNIDDLNFEVSGSGNLNGDMQVFLNWQLEIGRKYRENIDEEGSGALFGAYHYLIFVATELEDAESNRKI